MCVPSVLTYKMANFLRTLALTCSRIEPLVGTVLSSIINFLFIEVSFSAHRGFIVRG